MEEIEFGRVNQEGGDKDRVTKLVHNLERLLHQIVSEQECDFMFYHELIKPMREAWGSVSERFLELKNNVDSASIDSLANHGLTGSELQYKIAVINHAGKRFFYFLSERVVPLASIWLKKLLEALDKFLTSLFDAVGGGGAIGEYKSFIESSINDGLFYAFDEYV